MKGNCKLCKNDTFQINVVNICDNCLESYNQFQKLKKASNDLVTSLTFWLEDNMRKDLVLEHLIKLKEELENDNPI